MMFSNNNDLPTRRVLGSNYRVNKSDILRQILGRLTHEHLEIYI